MTNQETYQFPATPTQKALWFIHRMDPASAAYNIPLAFRVRGRLNESALRDAFSALVARHEILRTVFAEREGILVQIARAVGPLDWRTDFPAEVRDTDGYCRAAAARHVALPFDLETGPLLRVRLEVFDDSDALLVVVFHHIVIDHLSLAQCAEELTVLYAGLTEGRQNPLPPQEFQFADYAIWLEEHSSPDELERKLAIWQQRLSGFSGVLDLPLQNPRPAIQGSQGAEHRFSFEPGLAREARVFARREGVSLFVLALSALKVLIREYSNQDDVIIGVPFANRGEQEEIEHVAGCFINTLPVATDFSGIDDLRQLLDSVKAVMLEALEVQDVPLETIVERIKPRRHASHNPIFQIGFVLQAPPVALQLRGLDLEDLHVHSGGAMYDLHFWIWETAEGIDGLVWYNTDLYIEKTVERIVDHYQSVLAQLLAQPDASLRNLTLVTPAEAARIAEWNGTTVHFPLVASVVDLFREQVARTPGRMAVIGAGGQYSFEELDRRSDQLAGHLAARGVQPGDLVGVALDRDADLMVGMLGILKSGAAYLPLDPDYPAERLKYMMDNANIDVLLSEAGLVDALPEGRFHRILLDRDWSEIERTQVGAPVPLEPELRMYVIYTSGSTGIPNGVEVTHRNVLNLLQSMQIRPGLATNDRLLSVTTLSFDIAVLELYLPLIAGAATVIASREAAADGSKLRRLIVEEGITMMQATPSTWRILLGAGWKAEPGFKCLCGGEAFPPDLAAQLRSMGAHVWNMYGPTETTVWSTCHEVAEVSGSIPLGKPIANTSCHILNDRRNPVPPGIPGELYIGGEGVTLGYLNRPDLTRERFISNPWGDGLLYRTGDFVRYLEDGDIEYLHRIDHQVKVRGFRIELGEIEMMLNEHPAVAEAVVLAREYNASDKRLVAYVRYHSDAQPTNTELRQHLRVRLPDYMIPQLFVEVDAIPLTPSGKLDRKALPDPLEGLNRARTHAAPRNPTERRLMEIWEKALNTANISVESNFFDSGGHSLLALQVVFQVEKEFGIRLNPLDLILNTLEQLAARLDGDHAARPDGVGDLVGRVRPSRAV